MQRQTPHPAAELTQAELTQAELTQAELTQQVVTYTERKGKVGTVCPTGLADLTVLQSRRTTPLTATLYEPVVCLILQGSKEVELGSRRAHCGPGQSIIVSHDLPIRSRITEASAEAPYVALILDLDLTVLGALADHNDDARSVDVQALSLVVGHAEPTLIDALSRLFAVADNPGEAAVLAPLIRREVHYRLLGAEHGAMLRQLLRRESHPSRISKAIARIRENFTDPPSVAELAGLANMSQSSFHHHFKAITATTPLQYQKDLRLLEARRLLTEGHRSVTEAAFSVGYQSPTQFSREYSRKFGTAPRTDKSRPVVVV